MSDVADRPDTPAHSGARAFARLDTSLIGMRRTPRAAAEPAANETAPVAEATPATRLPPAAVAAMQRGAAAQVETVTLNKLGDFLELDFGRLFTWLKRGMMLALILAVIGGIAGGIYSMVATPKYTVSTDIWIDPANLQALPNDLYQQPGQVDNALLNAGSKLRVLTSGNVLARVVDELNLTEDKEFFNPTPGFSIFSLIPGSADKAVPNPKLAALAALSSKVTTRADEKSFVASLFVSTESSEKSIKISDAIVRSFQAELANSESDGASRTADSLNNRLNELKASVKDAEEKVEAYKRAHNLAASSGELVNNQTLTQLNAQVVTAQAAVIAAQSSYDELVAAGAGANTADTQASASLVAARSQVASLKSQLDSQSTIYGPRHPTIVKLNTELAAAQAELNAEIGRISAAAKVTLDQAKADLQALTDKADALKTNVFSDNEALVALRELERDAASKTTIYEAFLSRAKQVAEQEQIDTTNVRVISTAVPPPARSWPPRTVVLLAAGAFGGFALGMLIAVVLGIRRDLRQPKPARRVGAVAAA
jgi:uncharacterized protein involved in exopolysaccharide biosynthesis